MKFEDSRNDEINRRQEQIYQIIVNSGATGVTDLSKMLGLSLSTMQKHLTGQKFFKINEKRKWDLPERVVNSAVEVNSNDSVQHSVQAMESTLQLLKLQLEEAITQTNSVLAPVQSLKRELPKLRSAPPVAESAKVHSGLIKLNENINQIPKILRAKKEMLTEDLLQLLLSTDWMELILDNGRKFFREVIETNLYDVLLGNKDELSEEALSCIKEYQTDKQDKTA